MNSNEILRKHGKRFARTRLMLKLLLVLTGGMLLFVQWDNLIRLVSWLFSRN